MGRASMRDKLSVFFQSFALKREHVKQGLIMGVGSIIICALTFPDVIWDAFLTQPIGPALMLVVWSSIAPANTGFALASLLVMFIGNVFAAIVYSIAAYSTYAATYPSYAPSTTKAVTLSFVMTALVAIMHLIRVRWPVLDVPGMLGQLMPGVFLFASYELDTLPVTGAFAWENLACALVPALIGYFVTVFIVPANAGRQARTLFKSYLKTIASIHSNVTEIVKGDVHPTTGYLKAAGEEAKEGRFIGVAEGLEQELLGVYQLDNIASKLIVAVEGLTSLSAFEVQVYHRPHIFPRKEFSRITVACCRAENILLVVVNLIQQGKLHMRDVKALHECLDGLRESVSGCCAGLGEVIEDDKPYTEILKDVSALDSACTKLQTLLVSLTNSSKTLAAENIDDAVVSKELGYIFLLSGNELRNAFGPLPKVISVTQPTAASEPLFQNTADANGNAGPQVVVHDVAKEVQSKEVEEELPSADIINDDGKLVPPVVVTVQPSGTALQKRLFSWGTKLDIRTWQMKLVLHMTITFAIAAALNTSEAVVKGLRGRAYWILITVIIISDTTSGGVVANAMDRMAGTLVGSIGICITFSLSYVANGYSYEGYNTAKKITQSACVTIWMSILHMYTVKVAPRHPKFFTVSKLLVPLLGIIDGGKIDGWYLIGWRIAATLIAILADLLVTLFIFPVTTIDHVRHKTVIVLEKMAVLTNVLTRSLNANEAEMKADASLKDAAYNDLRKNVVDIIKMKDVLEKESVAGWIMNKFQAGLEKVWCCGGRPPKTLSAEYQAFTPAKLDQLICYLRHCLAALLIASKAQSRSMASGAWARNEALAPYLEAIGNQTSESLKALRLVVVGMAPMEDAVETVKALGASLSQINKHVQQEALDAMKESGKLSPAQNSTATALVAWNATYRNLCCLYRATELALVSLYDDQPRVANEMLHDDALSQFVAGEEMLLTWVVDQNSMDILSTEENDDGGVERIGKAATVREEVYLAAHEFNKGFARG